MPDWLDEMRRDLDAELGRAPKVATRATIAGPATAPTVEARSVAIRALGDDGSLTFTSDGRSGKNAELAGNASAALVFWLPQRKRQYRLTGTAAVLQSEDPARQRQWRAASDAGRAMFLWPPPGQLRDDAAPVPSAVSADAPVPDAFTVVVMTPARVERLDLSQTPHLRERWSTSAGGWARQVVNP
jgi:pyridoxamine 5'-phosphate oxidase